MPEDLKELRLRLHYRGNELELRVRRDQIDIESTDFPVLAIVIGYREKTFELKPGSSRTINTSHVSSRRSGRLLVTQRDPGVML